jgi:hypothetical protein
VASRHSARLFSALLSQQFNAGAELSFTLNITNNFGGLSPDLFAMYVYNAGFDTCYSDDLNTGAMLVLNLTGGTLSTSSFILDGASDQNLTAPVVSLTTSGPTVAEPSSFLLLASGLAGCLLVIKLRR